jgi:2C-methyl-D-erythritol 2,4-cyclodiphosphate synthase
MTTAKPDSKYRFNDTQTASIGSCPHEHILYQILDDQKEMKDDVHAIRDAVVGTAEKPGLGEKFRTLDSRVKTVESGRKKIVAVGWAGATALVGAAAVWTWDRITGKL